MPLSHELHTGDVILHNNEPRTILYAESVGVDQYALFRLTFNDGRLALVSATQAFVRLHPPESADPQ